MPQHRPGIRPSSLPRRQTKRSRLGGWTLLFGGCLLAALGGWALLGGGPLHKVPVTTVREGTLQILYAADAVVARREFVQQTPAAGAVKPQVTEGQRVRVGASLAWVVPDGGRSPSGAAGISPADVTRLQDLYGQFEQISHELFEEVVAQQTAADRKETSNANQHQRQVDQLSGQQSALAEQISRIETHAAPPPAATVGASGPREVTARRAGIVSFRLDGLETRLDPQQSQTWDVAWFNALPANLPASAPARLNAGQDLVKIVDNLGVSVAFLVPEAAKERIQQGALLRLLLTDLNAQIRVRMRRMSPASGGKMLVVADADTLPDALLSVRRTGVALEAASWSGLIVPRQSVMEYQGESGVWVLTDNRTHFVPAQVLGSNEAETVIAGALQAGDAVLLQPPS